MQEEIYSTKESNVKSAFNSKKVPFVHGVLQDKAENQWESVEKNWKVQCDPKLI